MRIFTHRPPALTIALFTVVSFTALLAFFPQVRAGLLDALSGKAQDFVGKNIVSFPKNAPNIRSLSTTVTQSETNISEIKGEVVSKAKTTFEGGVQKVQKNITTAIGNKVENVKQEVLKPINGVQDHLNGAQSLISKGKELPELAKRSIETQIRVDNFGRPQEFINQLERKVPGLRENGISLEVPSLSLDHLSLDQLPSHIPFDPENFTLDPEIAGKLDLGDISSFGDVQGQLEKLEVDISNVNLDSLGFDPAEHLDIDQLSELGNSLPLPDMSGITSVLGDLPVDQLPGNIIDQIPLDQIKGLDPSALTKFGLDPGALSDLSLADLGTENLTALGVDVSNLGNLGFDLSGLSLNINDLSQLTEQFDLGGALDINPGAFMSQFGDLSAFGNISSVSDLLPGADMVTQNIQGLIGGVSLDLDIASDFKNELFSFSPESFSGFSSVFVTGTDGITHDMKDLFGVDGALTPGALGAFSLRPGGDTAQLIFEVMDADGIATSFSITQDSMPALARKAFISNIKTKIVPQLRMMTEQLSALSLQTTQIIGSFFDAKHQLETQREVQTLVAQAHKDYHPGEQLCQIGSFVRSVAKTEAEGQAVAYTLNETFMGVYNGTKGRTAGYGFDQQARFEQFQRTYCDPADGNGNLRQVCNSWENQGGLKDEQVAHQKRFNKDIDYIRTLGAPLTIKAMFSVEEDAPPSPGWEDLLALGRNLYMPISPVFDKHPHLSIDIYDQRAQNAVRNVAHSSFLAQAAMKAQSHPNDDPGAQPGPAFMKALLADFGMDAASVDALLGENPSYYAQMEMLTKKLYQNPDFYTNLYDKPQNVRRVGTAMEALQLMQARDHYNSALRKEMALSMLVERALQERAGYLR